MMPRSPDLVSDFVLKNISIQAKFNSYIDRWTELIPLPTPRLHMCVGLIVGHHACMHACSGSEYEVSPHHAPLPLKYCGSANGS